MRNLEVTDQEGLLYACISKSELQTASLGFSAYQEKIHELLTNPTNKEQNITALI